MKSKLLSLLIPALFFPTSYAISAEITSAPQPTTCIGSTFISSGDQHWKNITLQLTNNCGKSVDFQNASITFVNDSALNIAFSGVFTPLSDPDNVLQMIAQSQSDGTYLETLNLHFSTNQGAVSVLPAGKSIILQYGIASDKHIDNTTKVYLGTPIAKAVETINMSATPVAINGQLKVCGTQLCNQSGQPIQLKGMSIHGLQWFGLGVCLTSGSLDALANSFGANVIRLSLYVQEGGYETNPVGFTKQVNDLINEATARGMYVIVDWHILTPGDPNVNFANAQKFFTNIATTNKGKVNLLYEIANEPNGVSWASIKNYAEKLIPIIRAIDPTTPIIIGTRAWSSFGLSEDGTSQEIIDAPVSATNIMYSFHFYAVSHRDKYLNELDKASNTLPVFVTEWGSQNVDGDGDNDFVMSDKYLQLMAKKKIGWTNWNFSDDFRSGAIWNVGTCPGGAWSDANLKPAGVYVKAQMK